ncbi:carbohydrate kinase family protein [Bailinhaonella thermotolerans]|uniref:carbohydrate kinase family protein n=1 Tax=Bailinhaonella thermotolerans TaxID=1070861 RepID=UPI00192A6B5D|nr:carbohydrate kinase [Bailinhaonella thermotolerans]
MVGESLIDLVAAADGRSFTAHPGGSPANVAVGLARLGVPVTLHTALAADHFGRLVESHVTDSGVRLAPHRTEHTSLAVVTLDGQGVPEYDFRLTWDIGEVPLNAACLHTGSLAAALPPGASAVEALMSATSATVTYDPNIRPPLMGEPAGARARVERQVALSDVVKVSEEDLAWLYPGEDAEEVAASWRSSGPALVILTLGENGCTALTAHGRLHRPGIRVKVADTVGAGDAFMSGLLSALHAGDHLGGRVAVPRDALPGILDTALRSAAITCTRPGADPPTQAELAGLRLQEARP